MRRPSQGNAALTQQRAETPAQAKACDRPRGRFRLAAMVVVLGGLAGWYALPANLLGLRADRSQATSTLGRTTIQTTAQQELADLVAAAPTIALELFIRHEYADYWRFKALAIATDGTYAAAFRAPDDATAELEALQKCAEKLRWHADEAVRQAGCKVFARGNAPRMSAPAGPGSGPDRNADAPAISADTGRPGAKLTLIIAPTCHEPGRRRPKQPDWIVSWHDWIQHHPDVRSLTLQANTTANTEKCPTTQAGRDRWARATRALLRSALLRLERGTANQRIWIWADGLGAAAALTLDRAVSGVVTTRYPCAFEMTGQVLLPPSVHVISVQSEDDRDAVKAAIAAGARKVATHCKTVHAKRTLTLMSAHGRTGAAPLWAPKTAATLASALSIAPLAVPAGPQTSRNAAKAIDAHFAVTRGYAMLRRHKAMVIGFDGRMYDAAGSESVEAASAAAFFKCHRATTGSGFRNDPNRPCELFAVDDRLTQP